MAKITGVEQHVSHLEGMISPEAIKRIGGALFTTGQLIQTTAQHSITTGSVGGKEHIPSRPGEPPNADTGTLDRQIETVQVEPLKVEVSSNAPYAAFLEYGTSRMEERPYMRPALRKCRHILVERVKAIIDYTNRAARRSN